MVHDLDDESRTGGHGADRYPSLKSQDDAERDRRNVGDLADNIEEHIVFGGSIYLRDIGVFDAVVARVELALLHVLVGKGAHQADAADIFLHGQVEFAVPLADIFGNAARRSHIANERHHKKRRDDCGNDQKIRILQPQKYTRYDQYEYAVAQRHRVAGVHFLIDDDVGIERCQKFARVVLRDRRAVQIDEFFITDVAQFRFKF